jgi:transposase InsO family protein
MHWLLVHGPRGEIVRVKALYDGGAMVGAMCASFFKKIQHRLDGQTKPSNRHLRVANGVIVPSQAMWSGVLELGGLRAEGEFEIFDSGGGWEFLFGKPLLHNFKALHDFETDTVTIRSIHQSVTLRNNAGENSPIATTGISLTLDVKQREISVGGSSGVNPPSRQVSHHEISDFEVQNDKSGCITGSTLTLTDDDTPEKDKDVTQGEECLKKADNVCVDDDTLQEDCEEVRTTEGEQEEQRKTRSTIQGGGSAPPLREVLNQNPASKEANETDELCVTASETAVNALKSPTPAKDVPTCQTIPMEREDLSGGSDEPPSRGVPTCPIDRHETTPADSPCFVLPVTNASEASPEDTIFTRQTDPFLQARVSKILELVQIGDDITAAQCTEVKSLISEFADCFALSLNEVNLIPGAVHKLNVPEDATFRTKIPQRSFNPDQRAFMEAKVDEMLKGGIIRPMHPGEVKCVAPSVLAQKAHENTGLSSDELKHKVNDECIKHGLPTAFDLPPRPPQFESLPTTTSPKKWRLCQDFGEINKVTPIAPVPQGDIRAKQLRLSGHRYIHIFDFAAGFYGIAVHPDSQPYITFYLEGHGHFAYERMPFGVTGGPAEFGYVVGQRMHDLIADGTCENFVDDGGSAADSFDEGMAKLRRILERVRKERLSLSPSKFQVFMTEAVFAGARVGPGGVSPDSAKLTAVVNWKIPEDASHLEGFLGLTAYFRDLVKGYAALEKPLRDLLRAVDIPNGTKKSAYQRIMRSYKLQPHWKAEHTATFINLKARLVSEPVLTAPRFDGTHFILTTDACKDAFAGVLSQKIKTTLPGGKDVVRLHPIGFTSKRTSTSEEKYKPFLLEFAALKYSFDKFSDIVYGYPVEVETDCQALRDILLSDKLSATHAQWRDGVLAHNIVDVRHIPGKINIADGVSRQYEGMDKIPGDGSEWTVTPDWEEVTGLVHDLYHVAEPHNLTTLKERFKEEPLYLDVIDAIIGLSSHNATVKEKKRAQHRKSQYMLEDGKLWFVGGGSGTRARARRECVSRAEAIELAKAEHEQGGHWHRDAMKLALLDRYHSPKLDESIVKAIMDCARCKNFGGTHLHSLLQPITRRHPFELLVGDYLSLPVGKGGFHTAGIYLDTCSQHVWGYKFKTHGTATTTNRSLDDIFHNFAPPETFMADGGRHFKNREVADNCERWGTKLHTVAAYSPWVNGLVEGTNKLLLYVLARLCAPEVGEDGWQATTWDKLPATWPDYFDKAIRILNWRILPALKFSPKEILLGLVVNTSKTPLEVSCSFLPPANVDLHMTYAAQQRLDGYAEAVHHAVRRKTAFDRRVRASKAGVVNFEKGQLVQVYDNKLASTLSTERKIAPMWSPPRRIAERLLNSYKLETLEGTPLDGLYHARRLRRFIPREGTSLAAEQKKLEEALASTEPKKSDVTVPEDTAQAETAQEEPGESEQEDPESRSSEWEDYSDDRDEGNTGFFHENEDEEEVQEEEGIGIGARVAARRRGRLHNGGGQME